MAKKPKRRKNASKAFPPPVETTPAPTPASNIYKRPMRWDLLIVFLFISITGSMAAIYMRPQATVPRYTYKVMTTYPHDADAFTP